MRPGYASGFETMRSLVNDRPLEVTGQLPDWLRGTLIRNGPGLFEAGPDRLRHWFDGLAVLHQFKLGQGQVHYRSQPLQSPDFLVARRRGRLYYSNFATDPCVAKFRRLFSAFFPRLELGANANVNVTRLGERFLALTETPMAVEFDPRTLSTLGVIRFEDPMADNLTTAHPHHDANRGSLINVTLELGPRSTFRLTELLPGATRRQVLGAFPVERPSYLHSFGMAENWFILTLGALVVDPRKLLLRRRPFIENYRYEPERGTTWALYDRRTSRFQSLQSEALFTFHHVNAFEQGSDLVVDLRRQGSRLGLSRCPGSSRGGSWRSAETFSPGQHHSLRAAHRPQPGAAPHPSDPTRSPLSLCLRDEPAPRHQPRLLQHAGPHRRDRWP